MAQFESEFDRVAQARERELRSIKNYQLPAGETFEWLAHKQIAAERPDLYDTHETLRLAMQGNAAARAALPAGDRARLEAHEQAEALAEIRRLRTERFAQPDDPFVNAIERELKENFGGDRSQYGEAMEAVADKRPELAVAYISGERFAAPVPDAAPSTAAEREAAWAKLIADADPELVAQAGFKKVTNG